MNNAQKHTTISNLPDYWLKNHPDCFVDLADGRRTFRQELLDLKHDILLTELYNQKKTTQWPMWLLLTTVFVLEVLRYVV